MRLANAFFCEYTATTREGKLDAGGILNLIWSNEFPILAKILYMICTIELEVEDYGNHVFELLYSLHENEEHTSLIKRNFFSDGRFHRIGIDMNGVEFLYPGLYRFLIRVDDLPLGDATLAVSSEEPKYPMGGWG